MIKKIRESLQTDHILLVGKHGVGKTYLIKELCAEQHPHNEVYVYSPRPGPPGTILKECLSNIENAKISGPTLELVNRLKNLLLKKNLNLYLFLDDFHLATAAAVSYFRLLQDCKNIRLVAIATTPYYRKLELRIGFKRFLWELKEIDIPEFTEEERAEFLNEQKGLPKKVRRIIELNKLYNPLALQHIIKNAGNNLNSLNLDIAQIKVVQEDAINLFPIWPALAAVLIAAKYLYRSFGLYKTANLAGFFGILAYLLLRQLYWGRK